MKDKKSDIQTSVRKPGKLSLKEKGVIIDRNTARDFYQARLRQALDPRLDDKEKAVLIKDVSLNDLKYICSLLFSSPLYGKQRKEDVLNIIRSFFDSEKRTADLTKNLQRKQS